MTNRTRRIAAAGLAIIAALYSSSASAQARAAKFVADGVENELTSLDEGGDFDEAALRLEALFDSVLGYLQGRQADSFRQIAFANRFVRQMANLDPALRDRVYPILRENEEFAHALVFVVDEEKEELNQVYSMVDRLRRERSEHVNEYANLAAAICVVHDRQLARNFNENRAEAPDAVALFDFYIAHEDEQYFGLKSIPAELLVYVVDVTGRLEDLQWAVARYAGNPTVGELFFTIQYDFDHYRTGAPKKCTLAGWGLPNILQYGGVCADQAYFAVTVGKAIGVPTAYTIGRGADVGHAWVGFLQADRRSAWWNFNAGRYAAYQGLRGLVLNPQTREVVDDSYVSLLADFALSDKEDRHAAAAFADAAKRLHGYIRDQAAFKPAPIEPDRPGRQIREESIESVLELLEAGLKLSPGYAPGWFAVRDLAAAGELTLDQKKRWASVLDRLCGSKYPDFSLSVLMPMVQSVDDIEEQNTFWNNTFRKFQRRLDLGAQIRMAQAEMWEEAGDVNMAGQVYMDVINRYANAGPFVVTALERAEQLLRSNGQGNRVLELYNQTWQRIQRPAEMAGQFVVQSNWYRVGMMLAERLDEQGFANDAEQLRRIINGG